MPLPRPTLTELNEQAISQINALVPGADARLRFSVLGVFAKVWAAMADGLYSLLNWLSRQLFLTTATGKYLEMRAAEIGINRLQAQAASGCIFLQGTAGAVIPNASTFTRADGVQYQTTQSVILPLSGFINATAICLTVGDLGNATGGVGLTSNTTIAGLSLAQVCTDGIAGGSDTETDDALRLRALYRLQNPQGAGTASDWVRWAKSLGSDVTRVWVAPAVYGNGTVGIVFATDNSGTVPSPTRIAQMQAHLNQFAPTGSVHTVFAPTLKVVSFTVQLTPAAQPDVQAAVIEELRDLLYRKGEPNGTIYLTEVGEAISTARGEITHVLTAPTANITFSAAEPVFEVGTLGTVTFI